MDTSMEELSIHSKKNPLTIQSMMEYPGTMDSILTQPPNLKLRVDAFGQHIVRKSQLSGEHGEYLSNLLLGAPS